MKVGAFSLVLTLPILAYICALILKEYGFKVWYRRAP